MVQPFIDAFLTAKAADGVSPNTVEWHRLSLQSFTRWLDENEHPQDPTRWKLPMLRAYVRHLQSSGLKGWTVTNKVQSLKAFLRWLYLEELIDEDIQARLKKPAPPSTQKVPFSDEELKRLIKASKDSLRDHAIVCLLLDTGLRANELCSATLDNLLPHQHLLKVMGKGNKERIVAMSVQTTRVLNKYLLKERDSDSPYIFVTNRAEKFTPSSLYKMLVRLGEKAQVEDVHPHRFRHTFALASLRNGLDPLTLQRLLGHTTLTMTNHYVAMTTHDLSTRHAAASPLAHLLGKGKR